MIITILFLGIIAVAFLMLIIMGCIEMYVGLKCLFSSKESDSNTQSDDLTT